MSQLLSRDPLAMALRGVSSLTPERPGPAFPSLPEADANDLLSQLGNRVMSGLGFVGGTLNKPGRIVRGLLGGRPHELLNAIPFSDTLGITDPNDEVTGRKLLEDVGIIDKKPTGGGIDLGDLLGFGTEVATDPLSYLTLGTGASLSKGGQIAAKVGALPATRAGRIGTTLGELLTPEILPKAETAARAMGLTLDDAIKGEKLAGLAGLGVPFSHPSVLLGQGDTAMRIAGGLDKAQDWLRWTKPGIYANALFSRDTMGATTEGGQRAALAASEAYRKSKPEFEGLVNDLTRQLHEAGVADQGTKLRQIAEGVLPAKQHPFTLGPEMPWPGAEEEGALLHKLYDQTGKEIGEVATRMAGTDLRVPWLGATTDSATGEVTADPNLGVAGVKSLMEQLVQQYPEAKDLVARRVSGIRERHYGNEAMQTIRKPLGRFQQERQATQALTGSAEKMKGYLDQLNSRLQSLGVDPKMLNDAIVGPELLNKIRENPTAVLENIDWANTPIGRPGQNGLDIRNSIVQAIESLAPAQADYFPRFKTGLAKETKGYGTPFSERFLSPVHQSLTPREEILRNIPGGTGAIEQLVADRGNLLASSGPADAGAAKLRAADAIGQKYLGITPEMANLRLQLGAAEQLNPQQQLIKQFLDVKWNQANQLADWLYSIDPQHATQGFFANHPIADFSRSAAGRLQAEANANAIIDSFIRSAPQVSDVNRMLPEVAARRGPTMGIQEAFKAVGMDGSGAIKEAARRLGITPVDAAKIQVPSSLVKDVSRFNQGYQVPDALVPLLRAADNFTNLFRPLSTVAWPAHLVRNWISGLWTNFVRGAHDPRFGPLSPEGWLAPQRDARALMRGLGVAGAEEIPLFHGMANEQATRALSDLMAQHGVVHNLGGVWDRASVEPAVAQTQDILRRIPGLEPTPGLVENIKSAVPRSLAEANPLNVAGVGRSNLDQFAPVVAGRNIAAEADNTNRAAQFIAYLRQGYDPAVAADLVKESHYDYSKLTGFERNVLRRIIPFYSWQRLNLPQQLAQIAEHPGGIVSQAIRAGNEASAGPGYVPEYIANGTAIPLPGAAPGMSRFLTQVGLPYESGLDQIAFGPGGIRRTAEHVLGQTNPLLKVPLELLTGKQFFQGRGLDELYQYPTPSGTVNELIANTPGLARASTTARTLMDERKSFLDKLLNLGTGIRITDVDTQKALEIEGKKLLEELMQGSGKAKEFTRLYVPEAERANLSPEETRLMQLYSALEDRATMASLQKKAAAGDEDARRRLERMQAKLR